MPESFDEYVARIKASAFLSQSWPRPQEGANMAKSVEVPAGFEVLGSSRSGGFGEQRYPWNEWLDGKLHLIQRSLGELNDEGTLIEKVSTRRDFETTVALMKNRLMVKARDEYKVAEYATASKYGQEVIAKTFGERLSEDELEDAIVFRVRPMTPEEEEAEDERRDAAKERAKERAKSKGKEKKNGNGAHSGPTLPTQPATPAPAAPAQPAAAKPQPQQGGSKKKS